MALSTDPTGPYRRMPLQAAGSVSVDFTSVGIGEALETATRWSEHSHPVHELLWNDVGSSTLRVGPRTWTVTPTIGLWLPAGTVHTAEAPAGTVYRATYFSLDSLSTTTAPQPPDEPSSVRITGLLRELLNRLSDQNLAPTSRRLTEAMVLDVLSPAPHQFLIHEPATPLLRPIADALLQNPADPRTLGDWARELTVSERTITRAFRAETGLGFTRWVGAVRIQRATSLLADGESLEDIAAAMGYRSPSAFGAAFRRHTGTTPSSLRR
ncbi:AraC family transcriptional regulator [Citricoccus sp. GCM10030269]|uniref:AraC family transcriptional regulator n=1 Tax=Citricoccus sp. GCM10030269 TaxID=3273388 RepID=UPI00360CB6A2